MAADVQEAAMSMADMKQRHAKIAGLMTRLSELEPSALSSHSCWRCMKVALEQFTSLEATLTTLVESATHPQPQSADTQLATFPRARLSEIGGPEQSLCRRLTDAIDRAGLKGVIRFAPQLSDTHMVTALWLMEEGGRWSEVANGLRYARQLGCCRLPVTVDAVDLRKHATKADYLSMPRVLAQWMVVGRHVVFRRADGRQDGSFELFRHGNQIRAVRDKPGFAISCSPRFPRFEVHPLSPHPFQQHMKHDDPPIHYALFFRHDTGWATDGGEWLEASTSSWIMATIGSALDSNTRVRGRHGVRLTRVSGGILDGLFTHRSPHVPLDGCVAVSTMEEYHGGNAQEHHLLTAFDDPFIAELSFSPWGGKESERVRCVVVTTEPPVGGENGPFEERYPRTAALVRRALGPLAESFFNGPPD
ncbi:unnamed protein product [Vitrella brassicaformis CCMP3155]|uniref:Uncharacterized protein n=2 Tax=Vitrella brassicaformis TaxID=1169539 RepID=A0A0G4EJR4_VITBC|nr:unnamed protein product [Vitrella brassicaformis CCMP3155]|eukprot:CEL96632.1 unnamed protein product [Vitrella brassicaformis CCMP3155]